MLLSTDQDPADMATLDFDPNQTKGDSVCTADAESPAPCNEAMAGAAIGPHVLKNPSLEPLDESPESDPAHYELRPQTRHSGAGFTSTWVDQDDTGDYDPSHERRKLNLRRNKVRHLPVQCASMPSEGADANNLIVAPARQEPPSLHVTLNFDDAGCKAKLKEILESKPTQASIEYDPFVKTWQPKKNGSGRQRRSNKSAQAARPNDCAHLPDDFTGYPIARGCWSCLGLGLDFAETCSLLHDEHKYPCTNCKAEGEYCTPILPPKYKQQCESCKQRRKPCSYTYTTDHAGPCEECAAAGYQCAAGPLVEEIKPRIRYDRSREDLKVIAEALAQNERVWQPKPRPVKLVSKLPSKATMEEAVSGSEMCSPRRPKHIDDRESCESRVNNCPPQQIEPSLPDKLFHEVTSTPKKEYFIDLTEQSKSLDYPVTSTPKKISFIDLTEEPPAPSTKRVASSLDISESPVKRLKITPATSAATNKAKTTTIKTGFCHPIAFNHEPKAATNNHRKKCNFCDGTSFPFLSLAPRNVQVAELSQGRGYTEIADGYASLGHRPTRMCTQCTQQRMTIMMCQTHLLRPLRSKDKVDFEGALDALFANRPRKQDKWCSLCPALAAYECQAEGCMDAMGNTCVGCGLMACETCRSDLSRKHGGDLQVMLRRLKDEPTDLRPLGLRADAEFLKQDGLLMMFVVGSLDVAR